MNARRILTALAAVGLGALAWRAGGWKGLALLASGLVLWLLLYYTRVVTVLRRAADRPIGYVGSAVMLNAKLKPKVPLLHVVALTRSLGQRLSAEGAEPEVYRWTDGGQSTVVCEFEGGRLARWQLQRPDQTEGDPPAASWPPPPALDAPS